MKLSRLIKIVDSVYDVDELISMYHKRPHGDYGDGLAKFVAVELAETYDPDASDIEQLEEAYRVMNSAADQLDAVSCALRTAYANASIKKRPRK